MSAALEHAGVLARERTHPKSHCPRPEVGTPRAAHVAPPTALLDPRAKRELETAGAPVRERGARDAVTLLTRPLSNLPEAVEPRHCTASLRDLRQDLAEKDVPVARRIEARGEPLGGGALYLQCRRRRERARNSELATQWRLREAPLLC